MEGGRLNIVSSVERGVRGRGGRQVDAVTNILPRITGGLQLKQHQVRSLLALKLQL